MTDELAPSKLGSNSTQSMLLPGQDDLLEAKIGRFTSVAPGISANPNGIAVECKVISCRGDEVVDLAGPNRSR
jgi:hypothetical protein